MTRTLPLIAAALGLLLTQAHGQAQPLTGTTQSPPAPNAQNSAPLPLNSVPAGSLTGATVAPGSALGGTAGPARTPAVSATPAVNSLHPMHPPRRAARRRVVRRPVHRASAPAGASAPQ